jgi:hypothetical protein
METAHLKASKRRRRGSIFNNAKAKGSLAKVAAMEAERARVRRDVEAAQRSSAAALARLSGGAREQVDRLEARADVAAGQEKGRRSRVMIALALREAALKTRELAAVQATDDATSFMERTKGRSVGEVLLDQRVRLAEMEAELLAARRAIECDGALGESASPQILSNIVAQLEQRRLGAAAAAAARSRVRSRSNANERSHSRAADRGRGSAASRAARPAPTLQRSEVRGGSTASPTTRREVVVARDGGEGLRRACTAPPTPLSPASLRRGGFGLLHALQASGAAADGYAAAQGVGFDWALHEDELLCAAGDARFAARARHGSPWER